MEEVFIGSPALVTYLTALTLEENSWDVAVQDGFSALLNIAAAERPPHAIAQRDAVSMLAWALYEVSMMVLPLDLPNDVAALRVVRYAPIDKAEKLEQFQIALRDAHDSVLAKTVEKVFQGPDRGIGQIDDKLALIAGEGISHMRHAVGILQEGWGHRLAYEQMGVTFKHICKLRNLPSVRRRWFAQELLEKRHERRREEAQ